MPHCAGREAGPTLSVNGVHNSLLTKVCRSLIARLVCVSIMATASSCAVVTPRDETFGAMLTTFQRIGRYTKQHGRLPAFLAELPEPEIGEVREFDSWGHVLHYEVDRNGIVSLTSFGRDGNPGGSLWNADFTMRYHSRRPDGTLWAGEVGWIVQGRIMPR